MSDEQWEVLTAKARSAGMNPSELIRYALLDDDRPSSATPEWPAEVELLGGDKVNITTGESRPMTQAERDAVLRRMNKRG